MRGVACIVLAAGGSTRFGESKQLQDLAGESLAHRAVRAGVECDPVVVIVVTGSDAEKVKASIADFSSISVITNESWMSGLSSSIIAGLRALETRDGIDGVLITLADQPLVDSVCLKRLLEKFDARNRIVASGYEDTVGAPIVIGVEHVDELENLEGDKGAGAWLKQRLSSVTAVPVPEAAVDIDTPQDIAHVTALLSDRSRASQA